MGLRVNEPWCSTWQKRRGGHRALLCGRNKLYIGSSVVQKLYSGIAKGVVSIRERCSKLRLTEQSNNRGPHLKASYGSVGGQHFLGGLIDHTESYGPSVIDQLVSRMRNLQTVVDIGAGYGRDLGIVRKHHPGANLTAIEAGQECAASLAGKADEVRIANIERDSLPFKDESVDLFIANQVLEHTKEIFWIFNEVSRSLKVGGRFLFGVPNICSLHNRILMLLGKHPTQHKACSAHVRPFSREDTMAFLNACFPAGYDLEAFKGSQFYPFPKGISRPLANVFPTMAFSIFFMIKKVRPYQNEFATYPGMAQLETNFWTGVHNSQYE